MGQHRMYLASLLLLLLPACEFNGSVGKDPRTQLQEKIQSDLLTQSGLTVEIVCPKLKKKTSATCDAKAEDGTTFSVAVSVKDENWSYQTEGVAFGSQIETTFHEGYAKRSGLILTSFTCPPIVTLGGAAICIGEAQDVKVLFEAMFSEKRDKARIDFKPLSGVVVISLLEPLLLKKTQSEGVAKVDCGKARLMVSKPKTSFTCGLLGADDAAMGTMSVLITDEDGHVDFKRLP